MFSEYWHLRNLVLNGDTFEWICIIPDFFTNSLTTNYSILRPVRRILKVVSVVCKALFYISKGVYTAGLILCIKYKTSKHCALLTRSRQSSKRNGPNFPREEDFAIGTVNDQKA